MRGCSRRPCGPVALAGATPLAPSDEIFAALLAARQELKERRREAIEQSSPDAKAAMNVLREAYQPHYRAQVLARAQSAALTARPFGERLVHFWSNHFAVSADKGAIFGLAGTLENEAIRPHVNGRFVELLTAVEKHPAMIAFLDNQFSVGADSEAARFAAQRNAKRPFGINENLAREILELHTLGVDGGYTQQDVTSFAQIITGWSIGGGKGRLAGGETGRFYFRDNLHEPGPKRFLGRVYAQDGYAQGEAVLADLAHHPSTAHFIATKLARHFIADDPPAAAVERLARAYLKSGGELPQVYAALIESPEAWEREHEQVQDTGRFRVFDVARPRRRAAEAGGGDPQLRSLRSAAVHTGVARRLGGYVQELGWLGCLDASGAVGVAGRGALRPGLRSSECRGGEPRRLRAARNADGTAPGGLGQPGARAFAAVS